MGRGISPFPRNKKNDQRIIYIKIVVKIKRFFIKYLLDISYYSDFNWEKLVFMPKVLSYFLKTIVYQQGFTQPLYKTFVLPKKTKKKKLNPKIDRSLDSDFFVFYYFLDFLALFSRIFAELRSCLAWRASCSLRRDFRETPGAERSSCPSPLSRNFIQNFFSIHFQSTFWMQNWP